MHEQTVESCARDRSVVGLGTGQGQAQSLYFYIWYSPFCADSCLFYCYTFYITALLRAARAALMLETQFSSCMRIRSTIPVKENKLSAPIPRTSAEMHIYVSARLGENKAREALKEGPAGQEGKEGDAG